MNILAVDAGNSRIKWGLYANDTWREQDWTPSAQPQLESQWAALPRPDTIIVSNVGGNETRHAIEQTSRKWGFSPLYICARRSQCGVTNGYAEPEQLGSDRWAALIAAHHLHPGHDLLVVQAGTAVTVDTLAADGRFRGGLIVPGLNLMLDALARSTAGLRRQTGKAMPFPDNTADAMFSGAVNALAGAVERSYLRLAVKPVCLLSGGDVDILLPLLSIPAQKEDNLVLEGLVRIALAT